MVQQGSLSLDWVARPYQWLLLPPPQHGETVASIHKASLQLSVVSRKPQLFPHSFVLQ